MPKRARELGSDTALPCRNEEYNRLIRGVLFTIKQLSAPYADVETINFFIARECFWHVSGGISPGSRLDSPSLIRTISHEYAERHTHRSPVDMYWSVPRPACCAHRLHRRARSRRFVVLAYATLMRQMCYLCIHEWCHNVQQWWGAICANVP